MTQAADIRRRADGSIDTEFHMDRARQLRSMELCAMASAARNAMVRLAFGPLRSLPPASSSRHAWRAREDTTA